VAKKSSNWMALAAYAVVGYLAYENWPTISAWFSSLVPGAAAATSTTPATAYYPNSPVPTSYPTNQNFVDSSGNIWQFSTQTSQWVIATPASPAPVPASAGTVVSTPPVVAPPTTPAGTLVATPAAPTTPAAPWVAPGPSPAQPAIQVAPSLPRAFPVLSPTPAPAPAAPLVKVTGPFTLAPSVPAASTPALIRPIYGMPHYRSY
jgi:hypothetical protein